MANEDEGHKDAYETACANLAACNTEGTAFVLMTCRPDPDDDTQIMVQNIASVRLDHPGDSVSFMEECAEYADKLLETAHAKFLGYLLRRGVAADRESQ